MRVVRTTSAGVDTQATTIAGVGDGTITLGDNLTVAKPAGSLVVLQQRNIEIRDSAATSNNRNLVANGTSAIIDCAIRSVRSASSGTRAITNGTSHTVQGSATISGCFSGIDSGTSHRAGRCDHIGLHWHHLRHLARCRGCGHQGCSMASAPAPRTSCGVCGHRWMLLAAPGALHDAGQRSSVDGMASTGLPTRSWRHPVSLVALQYRVNTADDSVFSYATPANGTDVYSVYKLNVAPAVFAPRVEIWPTGYEAAGTAEVTRRYPSTYIYGEYPRTWCNGGKTQSQTSVLPTGHTVGGQMIFEQHADIITAGVKANYCWNWVAVPVRSAVISERGSRSTFARTRASLVIPRRRWCRSWTRCTTAPILM